MVDRGRLQALRPTEGQPVGSAIQCVDEFQPKVVSWLWPRRVPFGAISLLSGDPGIGKSTLAATIAAAVSSGLPLPGSAFTERGAVLILEAEDSVERTLIPRLKAAGATTRHCHVLREPELIDLATGIGALERSVVEVSAKLLVIDPLMAFLGSGVDAYRDQDVRRVLSPLRAMAERTGAAVLILRHLNKASGQSAAYRGGGSIGIGAAARAEMLAGRAPRDESLCLLAQIKSTLGKPPPILAYRIVEEPNEMVRLVWEDAPSGLGVADVLSAPSEPADSSALKDAEAWLADLLAIGEVASTEVVKRSKAEGISERTLRRAKHNLQVDSKKVQSAWVWRLPAQGGQPTGMATLESRALLPANEIKGSAQGGPQGRVEGGQAAWPSSTVGCACGCKLVLEENGIRLCLKCRAPVEVGS
jgi:hypothetical protein